MLLLRRIVRRKLALPGKSGYPDAGDGIQYQCELTTRRKLVNPGDVAIICYEFRRKWMVCDAVSEVQLTAWRLSIQFVHKNDYNWVWQCYRVCSAMTSSTRGKDPL